MAGSLTLDDLKKCVADGGIDTVLVAQTDMQGRLMGKRVHAEHFVQSDGAETHGCNYLIATDMEMIPVDGFKATSWAKGYGDYVMKPDLSTLRRIPWLEGTALVLCDVLDHHGHHEVPHAPRSVLKRQVDRLAAHGWTAMAASELEFFLFRQSFEEADDCGYRDLQTISSYNEDYHIFQTTKEEAVMRSIRLGLAGADVPVENTKGEAEAGQEEINVRYSDALTMADRHSIMKNGAKEIAFSNGRALTFMAKWSTRHAGSSCHIHLSLRDGEDQPLFFDKTRTYGMSGTMERFLAGLLTYSSEITYFLAPYINSYKRYQAGTFAPTKAVWSNDNRTAGYRICADGSPDIRIECRIGGADLNPYLAYSAMLAAGLAGIQQKVELEPEFVGDAYGGVGREIPKTLRHATDALDGSSMLREAFGEEVVDHYVRAARWEQEECDRHVSDWEVRRGFERA